MISTTRLTISVIASSFRCPAVYWIIFLSAVKIRVGRTLLSWRSDPDEKSASLMRIAYRSETSRLVIWQRITSSPSGVARTRAGRFLALLSPRKEIRRQRCRLLQVRPCLVFLRTQPVLFQGRFAGKCRFGNYFAGFLLFRPDKIKDLKVVLARHLVQFPDDLFFYFHGYSPAAL